LSNKADAANAAIALCLHSEHHWRGVGDLPRSTMRTFVLALFVSLCMGCHRSGTWNDSPKNWERAFGKKAPADIKITHSRYMRSPHSLMEFQYFFQIEPSEKFRQEFNANRTNKLESLTLNTNEMRLILSRDKPEWFIPKPLDRYDAWKGKDREYERFRVFIDRETGTMFMMDGM